MNEIENELAKKGIDFYDATQIRDVLLRISKKLFRIEDKDERFSENKTWMRLRAEMEFLYNRLEEVEKKEKPSWKFWGTYGGKQK